ncbi:hypothetical protein [Deinococcus multiflagellatus]|uniref:Uncharacterized protein n=1 Tax=Deinococcus multiflagellatus TaxID=1656887 RepID=A0ABW1ZIJ4_9DEIO|nr:hypothetical protein [Deinococcus multiflagellatus]MBZ9712188.1 hypothetical protein [Deinococcus multiflagellatus]
MEPQRLASHPHCLTAPGTTVAIQNDPRTFTVRSGWVAYQSGKKRNAYILEDEEGTFHCALNGWLTPFAWVSDHLASLQACQREELELRAALRQAAGEN